MEVTGKLIQILPIESGTNWKKQNIIIENNGYFNTPICFSIFGDKLENSVNTIGNKITVDFEIESKVTNGKWYTNFKVFKLILFDEKDEVSSTIIIGTRPDFRFTL